MALAQLGHERRMQQLRDFAYAVAIGFNEPKKINTIGREQADPAALAPQPDGPPDQPQDDDAAALARAGADTSFVGDYF